MYNFIVSFTTVIYFTAQVQFTYQIWHIFGLHWISWLSLISRVSGCIVGYVVKFYLLLRWKSYARFPSMSLCNSALLMAVSETDAILALFRIYRMTKNFSVIRYCKQRLKIDIIAVTRNQRFAQQTYSELCESWGSGIFPHLLIPVSLPFPHSNFYMMNTSARKDERLSWPSWLTYSGRYTHISIYQQSKTIGCMCANNTRLSLCVIS